LKKHEYYRIETDPPEYAVVVKTHAYRREPQSKRCHAEKEGKSVTDDACSIIETRFHVEWLAANRALFVHAHEGMKIIWVRCFEHITLPASGAFA
jgi:hypothetical protein